MTFATSEIASILPLVISMLTAVWLSVCAIFDVRTRQVSNWLTLPAIPLALLAAWITRQVRGETLYEFVFHLVIMTLPLFVAWRCHLLGGADLKILMVLSLANPLLVVAAWIGVVVFFIGLLVVHHSRPIRFAGVPGFALGAGLFTIGQIAVLFTQHLAA
jgi:Flp pilus assembly protein protease CpaA